MEVRRGRCLVWEIRWDSLIGERELSDQKEGRPRGRRITAVEGLRLDYRTFARKDGRKSLDPHS